MNLTRPLRQGERGTQVLEFAIVLPLLMFIVMAITEGASFVRVNQLINNLAREGARIATLPTNNPDPAGPGNTSAQAICDAVTQYAAKNNLPTPTCTDLQADVGTACNVPSSVTCSGRGPCLNVYICRRMQELNPVTGTHMSTSRVTALYPYNMQFFSTLPFFKVPDTVQMKARAEFHNMYH